MMDELFEALHEVDCTKFISEIKFGLIVMDESGGFVHFCGYAEQPTDADREHLVEELETDEEFGLVGRTDLIILEASKEQIEFYKGELLDE